MIRIGPDDQNFLIIRIVLDFWVGFRELNIVGNAEIQVGFRGGSVKCCVMRLSCSRCRWFLLIGRKSFEYKKFHRPIFGGFRNPI